MSINHDDIPPQSSYPYFWSAGLDLSIEGFLAKYRPSMVQNDGTKPWLWVEGSGSNFCLDTGREAATLEAIELLKEYTAKVESIKTDKSIPIRSNKKTGAKSKKELREELQKEATDKLRDIAAKHNYFTGKWLMFAPPDKVDAIWETLAKSLVSGPLASSSARLAKVSTSPESETSHFRHAICIYIPNVYDKDDVTAVMKILLRNHGFYLSGVKSDLYTLIGLDSQHPSGIQSTIWKNISLMTEDEMKDLRNAYFAEVEVNNGDKTSLGKEEQKTSSKLKLKKVEDDPFMSDDDQDLAEETRRKLVLQTRRTSQKRSNVQVSEVEDSTERRTKKRKS